MDIPRCAVVTSAWVTFESRYTESNALDLDIYYEDTDDAYLFPGATMDPYNLTSRAWLPDPPCRWSPGTWWAGIRSGVVSWSYGCSTNVTLLLVARLFVQFTPTYLLL